MSPDYAPRAGVLPLLLGSIAWDNFTFWSIRHGNGVYCGMTDIGMVVVTSTMKERMIILPYGPHETDFIRSWNYD